MVQTDMKMNVLLVQLQVAGVDETSEKRINHVEQIILSGLKKDKVDLVLLPEMAFCSYCLPSATKASEIAREQEPKVRVWASRFALENKIYLAFGYLGLSESSGNPRNALAVYGPDGKLVHDQSKRFLYVSDEVWTDERAQDFGTVELSHIRTKPKVMFAICNDINAYDFTEEEMLSYPLARSCKESKAKILFLATAWCSAHPAMPAEAHDRPIVPSTQLEYWVDRLDPLIFEDLCFCAADLVGREAIPRTNSFIRYCGSSCCLSLKEPAIVAGPLDTEKEGTLLAHIPL